MGLSGEKMKKLLAAAFAFYVLLMLWLLFGQRIGNGVEGTYRENILSSINFVPFRTVGNFIRSMLRTDNAQLLKRAVINLAGNVVMFVPLGFFIPAVFEKQRSFGRSMMCSAISIAAVEAIQLFTLLGSCDIDDLILNMVGAATGYFLFFILKKKLF